MREQPYNNIGAVAKTDDKGRISNAHGGTTTTGDRTVAGSQRRA